MSIAPSILGLILFPRDENKKYINPADYKIDDVLTLGINLINILTTLTAIAAVVAVIYGGLMLIT